MISWAKKFLRKHNISVFRGAVIPMDLRQMRSLLYMSRMMKEVSTVEGSIVECGVGLGRTFLYLAALTHTEGKKRSLHGFDSFEGFPEPSLKDISTRAPKKGEWSGTSRSDVIRILHSAGLPQTFLDSNIHLIKGFVEKTLSQYDGGPIALLHIDLDLYDAYKHTLERLFPLVTSGGLVLFDEYGEEKWPGAKKAVDEYFHNKGYVILQDKDSGKYFVRKTPIT